LTTLFKTYAVKKKKPKEAQIDIGQYADPELKEE